jgi:hypothetical protein
MLRGETCGWDKVTPALLACLRAQQPMCQASDVNSTHKGTRTSAGAYTHMRTHARTRIRTGTHRHTYARTPARVHRRTPLSSGNSRGRTTTRRWTLCARRRTCARTCLAFRSSPASTPNVRRPACLPAAGLGCGWRRLCVAASDVLLCSQTNTRSLVLSLLLSTLSLSVCISPSVCASVLHARPRRRHADGAGQRWPATSSLPLRPPTRSSPA